MKAPNEILFEDNHVLVANKPASLATQPSPHNVESLETDLKEFIKVRDKKPANVFLHAIHRLDKQVSGPVLFAKSQKALSRLQEAMREKEFQKVYLALVEGKITPSKDRLIHYLAHASHKAEVVSHNSPEAKKSVLDYELIEYKDDLSFLKITLTTGRYHQIRAQMSAIKHPILGDKKYSSKRSFIDDHIALHHYYFSFIHPVKKEEIIIKADLPTYWPEWAKNLS